MFNIFDLAKKFIKQFSRNEWLILTAIAILFLITRFINLDKFPIFSDEGIYIHWAKVAWKDATWRFISLTDGRQPLQTWATIPFLKVFEHNALLAGRLFAVTSGFIAFLGVIATARYLFNAPTALIAGFLYVITPYFLFYDRIALVDAIVNAATIWMFLFSILLARTRRLDVALILGMVSGLALLAKSSVRLYIGLMAFAALFIIFPNPVTSIKEYLWEIKKIFTKPHTTIDKIKDIGNFYVLYIVVVAIAAAVYNVQRLSPFLHFVEEKNKTFILSKQEILTNPFNYFSHNILSLPYYIFSETGYLVAAIGIVGLVFMYKKYKTEALYFMTWLMSAILVISLVARVLFPRYVLSLGGLLIIPAAYAIANMRENAHKYIALIIVFCSVVYFNYTILFDYAKIPFPQVDRGQYLEGWPAGWGAKEIVQYARDATTKKPVIIIAEGNFGMSHDVLDVFLQPEDKIRIQPYWPLNKENLEENQKYVGEYDVLVVFAHRREFPTDWPMHLIERYDKPGNESEMSLFRLLPAGGSPGRAVGIPQR